MLSIRKFSISKIIYSILIAFILIFLIINSKSISNSAIEAINICMYTIIPSLFSFMVISNFIMLTDFSNIIFTPFNWLSKYIFKVNKRYTYIIILSLFAGYPIGAKLINELLRNNEIDNDTANRMILFCMNAGPAFIFGAVAIPIFNSYTIGIIIFISHILSCIIIGFISSICIKYTETNYINNKNNINYSNALIASINMTVKSIINICAFIILFAVITNILTNDKVLELLSFITRNNLNKDLIKNFFISILEVSNSVKNLINISSHINILVLSSGITAFGGVCIIFQVFSILNNCKIKYFKFILYRLIYSCISMALTYILSKFLNIYIPIFSHNEKVNIQLYSTSPIVSILLIILSLVLLFSTNRYDIISKKK